MAIVLPHNLQTAVTLDSVKAIKIRYFWGPKSYVDIQDLLMRIEWTEAKDQISRAFTLTLDNWIGQAKQVVRGGLVLMQYRVNNKFTEWFRGTVVVDSSEANPDARTKTITVYDALRVLGTSTGRFTFKQGKTASQHVTDMCRRLGIPIGKIEDTKKKLPAFTYNGKYYDAVQVMLNKTIKLGGKRFVFEYAEGKVYLFRYVDPTWAWDLDMVIGRANREVSIADHIDKMVLRGKTTVSVPGKRREGARNVSVNKKVTRVTSAVAQGNRMTLLRNGIIQMVDDVDEANSSKPKIRKAALTRLRNKANATDTLEIELPYDVMTFRRLQPVVFDQVEPVTQAKGRYTISSLTGRLEGSEASMSLMLTRQADFYVPEPSNTTTGEKDKVTGEPGQVAAVKGKIIGTPYAGTHRLGNWQSDNAVDISMPVGTQLFAVEAGKIVNSGEGGEGRFAGMKFTIVGSKNSWFYTHLSKLDVKEGDTVSVGDPVGLSGSANGTPHLHIGVMHGDPRKLLGY